MNAALIPPARKIPQPKDAHKRMRAIIANLETVENQIVSWFDAGHGGGCHCAACLKPFNDTITAGDIFQLEMEGTLYNVRHAQTALESDLPLE